MRIFILLIAALLGLTACENNDVEDLKRYVADIKSRPKTAIEPLPEIKSVEPFVFDYKELHDPFIQNEKADPLDETQVENGIKPDTTRPKEVLESYDLDALRMVGTVYFNNSLWGLLKAADGTIHRVGVGHYIGRNFGKIIRIKQDSIELLEIVSETPGVWHERKALLELSEANSEKK